MKKQKTAIIIGAGPAGLTAAYELVTKTDIKPIVFESEKQVGGISKTINYKGNRIDIGGHRFFSKSDQVMNWWNKILPLEKKPSHFPDKKMIVRNRISRIFYLRNFFDYPISLNKKTILNLGFLRTIKIGCSYLFACIFKIKNEKNLEDFLINRFGKVLYETFFKDYTEKVWGRKCQEISSEWGKQRIKGISVIQVLIHTFKKIFSTKKDIKQKNIETSLIGRFIYPKLGPGQMWEEVSKIIEKKGGKIYTGNEVVSIYSHKNKKQINKVEIKDKKSNEKKEFRADYFISTMAVKDLMSAWKSPVPKEVKEISSNLEYRDFLTVGLLLKKIKMKKLPDNWIYVQEPDLKVGRIQIFNNWSPFMVKNKNHTWLGLEYFCNEGGSLWKMSKNKLVDLATQELEKINLIERKNLLDSTVIKVKKAYPAYFGSYDKFHLIRNFTDKFANLFLIGRNGMHRYNNQDHSMLSAIEAVNSILGSGKKDRIWSVNAEQDYLEEKKSQN